MIDNQACTLEVGGGGVKSRKYPPQPKDEIILEMRVQQALSPHYIQTYGFKTINLRPKYLTWEED